MSYFLPDSDAFLTPEETSDDEETIEKEELQMAQEVSYYLTCMCEHYRFVCFHTSSYVAHFEASLLYCQFYRTILTVVSFKLMRCSLTNLLIPSQSA